MSNLQSKFEAIGTSWTVDVYDEVPIAFFETCITKIKTRIEEFDKTYSRFRTDSRLRPLAKHTGDYLFPKDAASLFHVYKKLYDLTQGTFTPLVGQILADLGYDDTYSLQPKKHIQTVRTWENTFAYEKPYIKMRHPAILDFGAAGKGYLIDIVSEILENDGIKYYCVDAGGDLRFCTDPQKALRIGLENPIDVSTAIGVVTLAKGSLCASAGNRRAWDKYHHIIDPHTHQSPDSILAVWTVAETTLLADAFSTCLFFVDPSILTKEFSFEYLILHKDFSIQKSKKFPGEIFTG